MKPALVLLNGRVRDPAAVRSAARKSVVIAADGGVKLAAKLKLRPRFVVGDMDSIPGRLPRWPQTEFLCDFDQYRSDFEKALELVSRTGFKRVMIAGASGGRLDHQLINLAVAERWAKKLDISLIGDGEARLLGPGNHALPCRAGDTISLLAAGTSAVVTTGGLYFPLRRAKLPRGSRGLSNLASGPRARIRVHSGLVWIIRS